MSPVKFLDEATIMKELSHPKIVKLLAIVSRGEPLMIITEFMDKGDLRNYLMGEEGPYVEEEELRAISYQVGYCFSLYRNRQGKTLLGNIGYQEVIVKKNGAILPLACCMR